MIEQLKQAIARKQRAFFMYKDKPRHVLPILLGLTKDDRYVLQGWQLGAGKDEGWRFFYLDELKGELALAHDPLSWSVVELKKSEGEYKPPAFIVEVLALAELS